MDFTEFRDLVVARWEELQASGMPLFTLELPKNSIYETYLNSYPASANAVFRTRSVHDCQTCRHFINRIGKVVAIDSNGSRHSIWGVTCADPVYSQVISACKSHIAGARISSLFASREKQIAKSHNVEILESGEVLTWQHFHTTLAARLVTNDVGEVQNHHDGAYTVLSRSLLQWKQAAIEKVKAECAADLYKGPEYLSNITQYLELYQDYWAVVDTYKDDWVRHRAATLPYSITRLFSNVIGTLITDYSNTDNWEAAKAAYLRKVDASRFRQTVRTSTLSQQTLAKRAVEQAGLMPSLARRFMTQADVPLEDVLWASSDTHTAAQADDPWAKLAAITPAKNASPLNFDNLPTTTWEEFVKCLPTVRRVEVLLEEQHNPNKVALVTAVNPDAPCLTSWGNHVTWTYTGDQSDRSIAANVAAAGGKIDGVLRASLEWNKNGYNQDDLDLRCLVRKFNTEIYFNHKVNQTVGGTLDIDIRSPGKNVAVENIVFGDLAKMPDATYLFRVNRYSYRNGVGGFRCEVAFGDESFYYEDDWRSSSDRNRDIATVTLQKGVFTIEHHLQPATGLNDFWGLPVNSWQDVSCIMLSPNHWEGTPKLGNKHVFITVGDMSTKNLPIKPFFVEYLHSDMHTHRRALEDLFRVTPISGTTDQQLTGLGFSQSIRASVVLRTTNLHNTTSLHKVNF
jgi:hypothetical protein